MAEETSTETTPTSALTEEKLAELIKANVSSSVAEAVKNMQSEATSTENHTQQTTQTQQDATTPDYWSDLINEKVGGRINQASLRAEAAEDRAEFYSSDDWLDEADEFLVSDDPTERKKEKAELKAEIEKTFSNALKAGKGMFRKDIFSYVIGEKVKKDRIKYQESVTNRGNKRKEIDLQKARSAVDITQGNFTNFSPSDIHKMSFDKVVETYGEVPF